MIVDIIFALIILGLLVFVAFLELTYKQERKDLLRMIKAKDLTEVTIAESVDKQAKAENQEPPDAVTVDQLDDQEFDKHIKSQLGN